MVASKLTGQNGRKKGWAPDSNSQVKCSINDLEVSMYNLKHIFISYSHKTETAENGI